MLFLDEIHRLSRTVEELLYSAMEDRAIDIMVGQGAGARALRLTLQPFTLVGATTRWSLLSKPLRDRFGMSFRLEHYGLDDLVAIVKRSAGILEIEIDDEGAIEIAGRSRGTPRVANRLLRRVRDYVQVHRGGRIDADGARAALELMGVDAAGLERLDRELLNALAVTFRGRPVGITTLAAALGEDAGTIEEVYEPYLLQRGLLERTPQGGRSPRRGASISGTRTRRAPTRGSSARRLLCPEAGRQGDRPCRARRRSRPCGRAARDVRSSNAAHTSPASPGRPSTIARIAPPRVGAAADQ